MGRLSRRRHKGDPLRVPIGQRGGKEQSHVPPKPENFTHFVHNSETFYHNKKPRRRIDEGTFRKEYETLPFQKVGQKLYFVVHALRFRLTPEFKEFLLKEHAKLAPQLWSILAEKRGELQKKLKE